MARFISADPLIQDPTHSQSYNRYSYVWNNPTNKNDPSGFNSEVVIVGNYFEDSGPIDWSRDMELRGRSKPTYIQRTARIAKYTGYGLAIGGAVAAACDGATAMLCTFGNPAIVSGFGVLGGWIGNVTGDSAGDTSDVDALSGTNGGDETKGDKDASTPTGQRGSPIDVKDGTNKPTNIGGRDYGGHALDQMQGRGVPPSAVEDAITNGTQTPGNKPNRVVNTSQDGRLVVVTEGGKVVTVMPK